MNKKFSTLVAGLLLAGAVGTANAQYSPVAIGEPASTVVANGAFQLANNAGDKVLALVRDANWHYTLKMVQAGDANLAETLWKISYTENKEGGPSFTFVSAAYGIPLSFTAKNADEDGVIADFPGNEAVWKWQTSLTKDNGEFGAAALINNYSAKLDSAIVLAQSNGEVVAKRYKTSNGTTGLNVLKLKPVIAPKTVLTADDLNSMMMTQELGKFKLTFNGEPQSAENGNIWTSQKLIATEPLAYSTSMYGDVEAVVPGEYNDNQRTAATKAKEAALALLNNVGKLTVVITTNETGEVADWVDDVKTAAASKNTFKAALKAVKDAFDAKAAEVDVINNQAAAANAIKTEVEGWALDGIEGTANTKAKFDGIITAPSRPNLGSNEGAFEALFTSCVTMADNSSEDFNISKGKIEALVNVLSTANLSVPTSLTISNYNALRAFYAGKGLEQSVLDLINSYIDWAEAHYAGTPAQYSAVLVQALNENAQAIWGAVDAVTFVPSQEAFTLQSFKTALNDLPCDESAEYASVYADVKAEILELIENLPVTATLASDAKNVVTDANTIFANEATEAAVYTAVMHDINTAITGVNSAQTVKDAITEAVADMDLEARQIAEEINRTVTGNGLVAAVNSVDTERYFANGSETVEGIKQDVVDQYVSLSLDKKDANKNDLYLAVDTNFVTGAAGRRHLKFASWYYNAGIQTSDERPLSTANKKLWRDYNGHFNFKFTYFPTADSLVIESDGYAMEPAPEANIPNWVDIPETMVEASWNFDGNGNTVMLAVLAQNHSEVTVGEPQNVAGVFGKKTLNTRIGFNATVGEGAPIEAGVYTIQYLNADDMTDNGRYIVANWLPNGQALAKVEDQDLNHIPAAQWMLSHENGYNINTIVNRESGEHLYRLQQNEYLPVQYLYSTERTDVYTTVYGDSLKLAKVDAEALKDSTLGYFAAAPYNKETNDQLNVYALKYLNNLASVFVNYTAADSILNVTAGDEAEVYFRLIPAADAAQYGASNTALAKDLYRQAYYLQLETGKANTKEEDKLYVTVDVNGKYRLDTRKKYADGSLGWIAATTGVSINPFFLKEFKEGDDHSYALIEARYTADKVYDFAWRQVSVKDYPSILIAEELNGEMKWYWGYDTDSRTSTFMLTAKDAPKYRRLGVTDAEDGLKDNDTNYAKIYTTRNANRYLYENSLNKVAGYEEDPLGLNFLGDINTKEATKNLALFIDTAYVRNNTARPQYMIALRPDFTPDTVKCEAHPSTHPYDLVDAVHADYLVTLADSVDAYVKKTTQDKFKFDGYTHLAFVPAKHIGDQLIIANSIYTGTKNADNDKKDLSKNDWRNGVWQFRLTGNDAEFYIEGADSNEFIRLVNGVAVVTKDIADAERFNIETTEEEATANEAVEAAEVSVVATQGAIIVKGAAGKVVTVANILGQTIANQVAASDNVTIAVPAGIAVVTVDGEVTKVVVK